MKSEVNIFTTLLMLFLIGCSKEAEEDIPVVITPSSATLIFPENNSECNEGKVISDTESIVNFRWEASQNTDRYLLNVKLVEDGSIQTITSSKINFDYRYSPIDKDLIFLSASFKGEMKNKNEIEKIIKAFKNKKDLAQPTKIKTGGSTFKNPKNQTDLKVWQLIKKSVSLDKKFGDAKISNKHCNFFINSKNAKFDDMKKLINYVKNQVKIKTGIALETEIEIIE